MADTNSSVADGSNFFFNLHDGQQLRICAVCGMGYSGSFHSCFGAFKPEPLKREFPRVALEALQAQALKTPLEEEVELIHQFLDSLDVPPGDLLGRIISAIKRGTDGTAESV